MTSSGRFINQQHDDVAFGIVGQDGLGDALHDDRLAGLGRRHQQAALALADGCHQVDDATNQVLSAAVALLQLQSLIGKQRRQVLEENLVLRVLRAVEVDFTDFEQREVAFAVLRWAYLAGNAVPRAQVEAADLAG